MSKPAIIPETTTSGIAVDPRTLERVIPESRRPDGTLRKQIKIRPGFTPQEDVRRFRGTRQAQMDANALPKGHVIGWTPPPAAAAAVPGSAAAASKAGMTKAQKKNEKRKEKRKEKRDEKVKDSWEDEDEDESPAKADTTPAAAGQREGVHTPEKPNWAVASDQGGADAGKDTADGIAEKLGKLEVR